MPSRFDAELRTLVVDEPVAHLQLDLWRRLEDTEVQVYEIEPPGSVVLDDRLIVPTQDIDDWEADADKEQRVLVRTVSLADEWDATVAEVMSHLANGIGLAALDAFERLLPGPMEWAMDNFDASKGTFGAFARAVIRVAWRRFRSRVTWRNLRLEKDDQDRRNAALMNEMALGAYLQRIENFLITQIAMRRRRPRRVIAIDAHCQDQVSTVVARVLELLRSEQPSVAFHPYLRVGRPAFLQVRDEVLWTQRRANRLWLVEPARTAIHAHVPRPDEALHRAEVEHRFSGPAYAHIRPHLSPTMARYLDALAVELDTGSLWGVQQRIAHSIGCSKSRVSEAFTKIRDVARSLGFEELLWLDDVAGPDVPGAPSRVRPSEV